MAFILPLATRIVPRAMKIIRGLDKAGTSQMYRTSTGQVRNVAANAPTLIRDASGKIVKLPAGQAVPAGATVINVAEAPVASIMAGSAGAVGVPTALAYQNAEKSENTAPAPQDSEMMIDPASGASMGRTISDNPIVARALEKTAPAATGDAPVYDNDGRSMPQDVEGWGRKVEGPSASTYSMDAPPNAVGSSPMRRAPMPLPPKRPESMGRVSDAPSQGGFFSGMFKDPYEGMSSKQLYEKYQDSPDNNALYFRAATKQAQEMKDARTAEEGMKRGGAAGSPAGGSTGGHHKDAAIMKALEIIHHMLRRG
jgi:hypothetical protein